MLAARRLAPLLAALIAALVAGGCGEAARDSDEPARLTVTSDFGSQRLLARDAVELPGGETAMRMLQRAAPVETRYGGGFVQCVEDVCGGSEGGRRRDWFYYVNGVEAPKGAAATRVRPGDRVWWDRRDWGAAARVPAVVGSFPEPFLHGPDGERLPVRVECRDPGSEVCRDARAALVEHGVPASKTTLRTTTAEETMRVVVGTWLELREDGALRPLEDGPAASGVFAEVGADGRGIALLDARGEVVRTLGRGAGLVAATRVGEQQPVWALTGTDEAGVQAAVRAFDEQTLRDRYAVAADASGAIPLPLAGTG